MRVSSTKTIISGNGAVLSSGNGKRLGEYDKWRMNWNGNMFAPPDASCVLYLPGHPGTGTTITDFSSNFLDSAIDTDEELDAIETDVTCDADATTAIPVGSVIRVGDELMYVSATGTILTVVRGYAGSHAVTHDTNIDIYRRTSNHGTITGATWKRLPSGLWYLDFDGVDDKWVKTSPSGLENVKLTASLWFKTTGRAGEDLYSRPNAGDNRRWAFFITGDKLKGFAYDLGTAASAITITSSTSVTDGIWHKGTFTVDGTNLNLYLDGVSDATPVSFAKDLYTTGVLTVQFGAIFSVAWFKGQATLWEIESTARTAAQELSNFNQERHLIGV